MKRIEPLEVCDAWVDEKEHRCRKRWSRVIHLARRTEVRGSSMWGWYGAGDWHFCGTHANAFERGRVPEKL